MLIMSNPFRTPEFKALFTEWNQVLELSGHREIENFNLPEPTFKEWERVHLKLMDPATPAYIESVRTYYDRALEILDRFPFKEEVHRKIWFLHCKGLSIRKIAQRLNRKKFTRNSVSLFIIRIRHETGLKSGSR